MFNQSDNLLPTHTSTPISLNPTKLSIEELISDIEYPTPPTTILNPQNTSVPIKPHSDPENIKPTKPPHNTCICKQTDFACPLIKCLCCHRPLHPICYGFFSATDIRCKDFVCLDCNKLRKQRLMSSNYSIHTIIRMRKLIYFVYQMDVPVKNTEIIKGCMLSKHEYSYTLTVLNRKVNLNDLFEISKKGSIKFYTSKNDETSKEILMNIFNGSMDMLEDIKK